MGGSGADGLKRSRTASSMNPPNTPADSFWRRSYFAPLDGLRAISVLLVVAYHVAPADGARIALRSYVQGQLAVDIFFVLSGFLITTLLLRERRESGTVSLKRFYLRRFFRIAPPYFLAIATYIAIGSIPSQREFLIRTLTALPYFLTFRNEYVPAGLDITLVSRFLSTWTKRLGLKGRLSRLRRPGLIAAD